MAIKTHWRRFGPVPILCAMLLPCALQVAWSQPATKKTERPACNRAAFRVVLDVGHTADVPGAKSARAVPEYHYNLRLAKEIEQALTDAGFAGTTLLITATAPQEGLFQRAERANSHSADLFLSIHHDSVPNAFLEKWEFEGEEYGFSDRFKGHSIFVSFDNADRKGSIMFGRLLGLQLKARGLQFTPHYTEAIMGNRRRELVDGAVGLYRYDQLVVLRHTRMPAVLLEAGSIINRDEELLLRMPEHRSLIAASVAQAVEMFCALRASRRPPAAVMRQASPGKQP